MPGSAGAEKIQKVWNDPCEGAVKGKGTNCGFRPRDDGENSELCDVTCHIWKQTSLGKRH